MFAMFTKDAFTGKDLATLGIPKQLQELSLIKKEILLFASFVISTVYP